MQKAHFLIVRFKFVDNSDSPHFMFRTLHCNAGAPLLLVHVSGQEAAAEIGRAQLERGHCVFGETCPQYLTLTAEKLKGDGTAADACGIAQAGGVCSCSFGEWEGAKYLCSPPLRSEDDVDALWEALRSGKLQVVSSDHSAYNFTIPEDAADVRAFHSCMIYKNILAETCLKELNVSAVDCAHARWQWICSRIICSATDNTLAVQWHS